MKGKVCAKCGEWKALEEYHKNKKTKDGRGTYCKECQKEYQKQWREKNPKYHNSEQQRQYRENNKERIKEYHKQYCKDNTEYFKQYREDNKERTKEYSKQYYKDNAEHIKEYSKQYRQDNAEYYKEYSKQYRKDNKEYYREYNKQHRKDNKEYYKEYNKQYRKDNVEYFRKHDKQYKNDIKEKNLQYISNLLEQIRPIFKEFNLPVYGYIYKFENIKTGHVYIGQTIQPLKERYGNNIIKFWIKERKHYQNQKFLDELIEEDFIVTELLDAGCCKYHLDKLEAYWINKYDSCNNGYNNREGYHDTDDGLEEFIEILEQHNLEFIDGQIVKIF